MSEAAHAWSSEQKRNIWVGCHASWELKSEAGTAGACRTEFFARCGKNLMIGRPGTA